MPAIPSGAAPLANDLTTILLAGKTFPAPIVDINDPIFQQPPSAVVPVTPITIADLTQGTLEGNGAFDVLMRAVNQHLEREFKAQRISGTQYSEAYQSAIGAALQTAKDFLLQKDQAFWAATLAQAQAAAAQVAIVTARVQLEVVRYELLKLQYDAAISEASYALTKMKLSTEDAQYDQIVKSTIGIVFNNDNILPAQYDQLLKGTLQTIEQTVGITYTNTNILPAQRIQIEKETDGLDYRNTHLYVAEFNQSTETTRGLIYNNDYILPEQLIGTQKQNFNLQATGEGIVFTNENILPRQRDLLQEQIEVQRAQTLNTRTTGDAVAGLIGRQKELYSEQITSYKRDAETKLVKLYTDSWITQKTIDEGLEAPDQFVNAEINEILVALRTNLGLGS
jgi:hypothetical protein